MNPSIEDRAMRKRVLIMRAAVERAELSADIDQLRASVRLPRLFGSSMGGMGIVGMAGTLVSLVRKFPFAGTALSLVARRIGMGVASGVRHPSTLLRATIKWGGLAALGWQGWRWWQRQRPPRNAEFR